MTRKQALFNATGPGSERVTDRARQLLLDRIVTSPDIMAGQPVIRGTRLTVHFILGRLGQGATTDALMEEYPGLTREDVAACLVFAPEHSPSSR